MKTLTLLVIAIIVFFLPEKGFSTFSAWNNAGLLSNTPKYAQHVLNVDNYSGTDNEKLLSALSVARGYSLAGETSILSFSARTYELSARRGFVIPRGTNELKIVFS